MIMQTTGTVGPVVIPTVATLPGTTLSAGVPETAKASEQTTDPQQMPGQTSVDEYIEMLPQMERRSISPTWQRLVMFLITLATPLVLTTGCDLFKKKSKGEIEGVVLKPDAATVKAFPDKAYMKGYSRWVSPAYYSAREPILNREAEKNARKRVIRRLKKKYKYRLQCRRTRVCTAGQIKPPSIEKRGKRVRAVYFLDWTRALCLPWRNPGNANIPVLDNEMIPDYMRGVCPRP